MALIKIIFNNYPELNELLWYGEFRNDGYFINTASKNRNEETITNYVKEQAKEKEYKFLHNTIYTILTFIKNTPSTFGGVFH